MIIKASEGINAQISFLTEDVINFDGDVSGVDGFLARIDAVQDKSYEFQRDILNLDFDEIQNRIYAIIEELEDLSEDWNVYKATRTTTRRPKTTTTRPSMIEV